MKKLQVLALAALVAFGFASCTKDTGANENGGGVTTGEAAKVGLSFSLSSDLTRGDGDPQAASDDEKLIQTVTVFIFDAAGNAAKTNPVSTFTVDIDGDATTNLEDAADVDFTYSAGTWTLKDDRRINTESGIVQVYVAANLPSTPSYANLNALLADVEDVATLSAGAGDFAMFSELKNKDDANPSLPLDLKPGVDGDPTTYNTITVSLGRVVSKVVATWDDAKSYVNTWSAGNGGVTLTYTVEKFNVYNEAVETYLAQNYTDLTQAEYKTYYQAPASTPGRNQKNESLNDFTASYLKGETLPANGNMDITTNIFSSTAGPNDLLKDLDGFYIGENNSVLDPAYAVDMSRQGNTTYAMIQTSVVVSKTAKWNETTKSVDWNATPTDGSQDLWVVTYGGNTYITNVELDATELKTKLDATGIAVLDAEKVKFPGSKVHFRKWLNKDGSNDYEIGRNEFIHVSVEGVVALDNSFPGYPGTVDNTVTPENEEDPEKPADPVKDPAAPVDPEDAYLIVKVSVKDWVYRDNSTQLGE